jgi:IS5 family transposase
MRPKKHKTTCSNDLFRARLDQIINLKHELVQLAGRIDWDWIDGEIAPLYSENGRPGPHAARCAISSSRPAS